MVRYYGYSSNVSSGNWKETGDNRILRILEADKSSKTSNVEEMCCLENSYS